ncbi:MAG: hypothetical protein IPN19_06935 [Elusimicrobia bacterium]|nr:hypothetical protein [Elusimicrobiota bacterium]
MILSTLGHGWQSIDQVIQRGGLGFGPTVVLFAFGVLAIGLLISTLFKKEGS